MAACSVYTGDAVTAQAIHDSWQPWTGEIIGPYMSQSLWALRWSIYDSLTTNQSILLAVCSHQPTSTIVYRILIWVILLYMGARYISSMSLGRRSDLEDDNAHAAALFIFIFICMTPLWLGLSCDFGRLSMQLFAITFISNHYLPSSIVPRCIVDNLTLLNYKIDKLIPSTPFITLLLLFTGISPCLFNIESLWDWSVINSLFEYFHTKWLLFHPQ
ncbi:MAG: hypothetical protein K2L93_04370 [Muribaculaceae bacterium]|nr:hypothetical protein [Muribaculaceae bacterium]